MKFNHKADSISEAIGVNIDSFIEKTKDLTSFIIKSSILGDESSVSKVSEFIHEKFDYNEILFMATQSACDKLEDAIEKTLKEFKKDFGNNN